MIRLVLTSVSFLTLTAGCATSGDDDTTPTPPPPSDDAGEGEGDVVTGEGEGDVVAGEGEGEGDDVIVDEDAAVVVDAQFPASLECGGAASATVTLRNTGSATWTAAGGYRLGAVDDSDPFSAAGRIELGADDSVAPGETHTFTIDLVANEAGAFTTDWRMVHELVRWFGDTNAHDVVVSDCTAPDFDFTQAIIKNSPDITDWAATARITTLDLGVNGVFVDFTKRDGDASWPDVPFGAPGDSLEYTLWIVINIDGQWYASGCIEYWRGLDRNGGPPSEYAQNWYYDAIRWGEMVGHQPQPGETVGFLVTAGDARNNGDALVHERSNVVFVPFPSDPGAVFTF